MMEVNRRTALAGITGAALATTGLAVGATRHAFVPHVLGANTAVTGYGLLEAIRLVQRLGFKTIEVQNLNGVPAPTPGQFPGFRIQDASDDVKAQIKEALAGFSFITTHLP